MPLPPKVIASENTYNRPKLTELLVRFAQRNCPGFRFTSIQVNKNYKSVLHVDGNNLGPSMIVGVGDYEGGDLWSQDEDSGDSFSVLKTRNTWQKFDGNLPHATLDYSGTRYTLIYFVQQSFPLLGQVSKPASSVVIPLES
eukprot:SAG22_NODE_746_length_7496_cov_5.066513_3_plen_141_part_00